MKNERVLEINHCVWMSIVKSSGIALLVSECLSNYVRKLAKTKKISVDDTDLHVYRFLGTMDFLNKLS